MIIIHQLLRNIDNSECGVMEAFKKFNEYECLSNKTKVLDFVQGILSRYEACQKKGIIHSLISFFKKEVMGAGQKESARIKSDMYFDKSVGKWIINGVEASEENDIGCNSSSIENVSENALILPPPDKDEKSEQPSASYKFSRYKAV